MKTPTKISIRVICGAIGWLLGIFTTEYFHPYKQKATIPAGFEPCDTRDIQDGKSNTLFLQGTNVSVGKTRVQISQDYKGIQACLQKAVYWQSPLEALSRKGLIKVEDRNTNTITPKNGTVILIDQNGRLSLLSNTTSGNWTGKNKITRAAIIDLGNTLITSP